MKIGMIDNFFTRCAIKDAHLRRLQEKVMKENLPVVFICGVRRYRGKSFYVQEMKKHIEKHGNK